MHTVEYLLSNAALNASVDTHGLFMWLFSFCNQSADRIPAVSDLPIERFKIFMVNVYVILRR